MLLDSDNSARLAPLYDIASILPHLGEGQVNADIREIRLAMRIDDKYLMAGILPRHWESAAQKTGFSSEMTRALLRHHIATLPDLASRTAARCRSDGFDHPALDHLVDLISKRAADLSQTYGAEMMPDDQLPGRMG